MDSTERWKLRVGGSTVEWQKIQLYNYRDEKRREVEGEAIMKNKLRVELNCQVDVERMWEGGVQGMEVLACVWE